MGKISPVSAKYIIHASIKIDGIVDRPDVIGAIFGQTEGLLGSELELRELQRSGRIGRIEVTCETRSGKTTGSILIPSSMDKAETAIIGAAMEVIQRIGPCNAKIKVTKIEDVRVSKRNFVVSRAKELLKELMDGVLPDSQEISDEVAYSVRVMAVREYGKERLPAGPNIDESDEILVVEGRADVLNLLKHGIKNSIAMNGTSVPDTIVKLCNEKITTVFVDGDRGGKLIVKGLLSVAEIDYVATAPDGKEVEEMTKKELHKALRSKIAMEQAKLEMKKSDFPASSKKSSKSSKSSRRSKSKSRSSKKIKLTSDQKTKFKSMLEDLIGTRGAYILDDKLEILGKVPLSELQTTIKSLKKGMYAVIFDGVVEKDLVSIAQRANINFLVAMDSKFKGASKVKILTEEDI
ncbi:MAG: DNA primase DnaG [Candidatus Woesearchaeota archaeon]|nr:DNA primase DnaG [Candidatus Woesearchaeota archaeon]